MNSELLMLAGFGVVFYVGSLLKKNIGLDDNLSALGEQLMKLDRIIMMILMAIPEQLVMNFYEPQMPLVQRLLVSIAMYVIHFAWNGMVMKPEKSYDELAWILGTGFYALKALGVKQSTAVALVAADSVMTLTLRGMA
jgi:hypothetical protein